MIDLIIAGDLHGDNLNPECRTDNYLDALCSKLTWLARLQEKIKAPIIFPGDLTNVPYLDSRVLNRLFEVWPKGPVYAVPGQHDLPNHNIALKGKSAYQTLVLANAIKDVCECPQTTPKIQIIYGCPWGGNPNYIRDEKDVRPTVLVWHVSTWMKPYAPKQEPGHAARLLASLDNWDLVITGDNHQTFVVEMGDRVLVNAGSVMRMRSDQVDHKPSVFLWEAKGNSARQEFFPISDGVISDEKIKAEKEREERKSAFVEKVAGGSEVSTTFKDNLKILLRGEDKAVKNKVSECTGGMV